MLYTNQFNNRYATTTDWVVSPKLYLSLMAGYLGYGSRGQTLTEFNTNTRRTFSQSNNVFPAGARPNLVQPNGYVDGIANTRTVEGRLHAAQRQRRCDVLRELDGTAHVQGRFSVRAAR